MSEVEGQSVCKINGRSEIYPHKPCGGILSAMSLPSANKKVVASRNFPLNPLRVKGSFRSSPKLPLPTWLASIDRFPSHFCLIWIAGVLLDREILSLRFRWSWTNSARRNRSPATAASKAELLQEENTILSWLELETDTPPHLLFSKDAALRSGWVKSSNKRSLAPNEKSTSAIQSSRLPNVTDVAVEL